MTPIDAARSWVAFALAALLTLAPPAAVPAAAAAADANPAASAFIRELADESIKELTDPAVPQPEREARFRRLLVEHFDLAAIAKFSLGRYWRSASDAQRTEFRRVFEDFLVHSYSVRFREYHRVGFRVEGSANQADGDVTTRSKIKTSKTEEVALDWRLRPAGDSFVVVDIVVEGVSMAVTQRADFGSIIQNRGGIDGLIDALRAKNAESAGPGPT